MTATRFIETEALLLAMEDADVDSGVYTVDEYLRQNFLPVELRKLENAAYLLSSRARHVRKNDPEYDPSKVL